MRPAARGSHVAAVLGFTQAAVLGYAVHRLVSLGLGEPDPRTISGSAHIGFYWRVGTALWWGVIAAALCARFPHRVGWLERTLIPVSLLSAGVLALFP